MRDAQLKLGELYLLSQRFPEAQESAERVLKAIPDSLEAHALLGMPMPANKAEQCD